LEQIGAELHHTMLLGGFAETLTRFGQCDEALSVLARATGLAEQNVTHYWDAELSRLRGEALLARNGVAGEAVESALRTAVEIARSQDAKMLELRAATSLGRLWRDQATPGEARDLLAPVYAWFTEGHDLPDLAEARSLLDELGWRPS
jgi:predicted ATPase